MSSLPLKGAARAQFRNRRRTSVVLHSGVDLRQGRLQTGIGTLGVQPTEDLLPAGERVDVKPFPA